MSFLANRRVAAVIMVIVIALAVCFGAHRSLTEIKNDVEVVFYEGVNGDGLGIENDLEYRIDQSYNLVTVARRYIDATDPAITDVLDAREDLSAASTPHEKYAANAELTEATTELYSKLGDYALSETDSAYRESIYSNLTSRNATISHDQYNQLAEQFNKETLGAFPANLLRHVAFVGKVELYE